MSTCKCGKVFDSDYQLGMDAQGNCACDDCEEEMCLEFIEDLEGIGLGDDAENIADKLMNMNYRKVK